MESFTPHRPAGLADPEGEVGKTHHYAFQFGADTRKSLVSGVVSLKMSKMVRRDGGLDEKWVKSLLATRIFWFVRRTCGTPADRTG